MFTPLALPWKNKLSDVWYMYECTALLVLRPWSLTGLLCYPCDMCSMCDGVCAVVPHAGMNPILLNRTDGTLEGAWIYGFMRCGRKTQKHVVPLSSRT
jgi:hypothetical protein